MACAGHSVTSAASCKLGIESCVGTIFWRRCSSLKTIMPCTEIARWRRLPTGPTQSLSCCPSTLWCLSLSSHTNLYTHSHVQYIGSRRMCNYQTDGNYKLIMAVTMELFHLTVPLYSCNAPALFQHCKFNREGELRSRRRPKSSL